jgi:hypothetical protein
MELAKPTINNTTITSANTEYSYTFPAGTRAFRIKLEALNALLKVAFVSGESGTNYITIPYGDYMEMHAKVGGATIYFQSPSASQKAQIETWK